MVSKTCMRMLASIFVLAVAFGPALAGASSACAQDVEACCCHHDKNECEQAQLADSCGCVLDPASATDRRDLVAAPPDSQKDPSQTTFLVEAVSHRLSAHTPSHHGRSRAPPEPAGSLYLRVSRLLL